jgi:hypothetical protein
MDSWYRAVFARAKQASAAASSPSAFAFVESKEKGKKH